MILDKLNNGELIRLLIYMVFWSSVACFLAQIYVIWAITRIRKESSILARAISKIMGGKNE